MIIQKRYRIVKLIGQGGFGKTFLALDECQFPSITCVIKQFRSRNQTSIESFKYAALTLEELGQHPQIPTPLDYFEEEGHFYLVQEFINGINLAELIKTGGVFDEAKIWQLLEQLLPVIKFIHDRQVIHRDIKPENIIRCHSDNRLVLVDFGAAKKVTELDFLQIGTSIGSAEYVAPEQAKGKAVFASDLYSLGVTCIYLVTGIRPFDLFDIANDRWVWREYAMGFSDRLAQIFDKLIQNAFTRRFQSADEVLQAIGIPSEIPKLKSKIPNSQWHCQHTLTENSGILKSVNSVAIHPDEDILATASDEKTIRLWNLNTGAEVFTISRHSGFVNAVAFSPDGKILASASDDKTIVLWELTTGQIREICTLTGHARAVKSVAFSPDGQILASGSWDKTVKLWDVNTGKIISTLTGHQLQITSVTFSPDGQLLASASFDRTVRLWQLRSPEDFTLRPQLCRTLVGHSWPVFSVAFSRDGKILASGSEDKTVRLWDLETEIGASLKPSPTRTLLGHSWSVVALTFSPEGETLVSGSWDKTVKLWKTSTGEEIATLFGHSDSVLAVAINFTGKVIASSSKDKTIKLWRLVPA